MHCGKRTKRLLALLLSLLLTLTACAFSEEAIDAAELAEAVEEPMEESLGEAAPEEFAAEVSEPLPASAIEELPASELWEDAEEQGEEAAEVPSADVPTDELLKDLHDQYLEKSSTDIRNMIVDGTIQPANAGDMAATDSNHRHSWQEVLEGETRATYEQKTSSDRHRLHRVTAQLPVYYECSVCHATGDTLTMASWDAPHVISNNRCTLCGQINAYPYTPQHSKHDWSEPIPTSMMEDAGFIDEVQYSSEGEVGHTRVIQSFEGYFCTGCDSLMVLAVIETDLKVHNFISSGDVDRCRYCGYEFKKVPVSDITLSQNELTLTRLDSETLTATIAPDYASDKSLLWSSSAEDVATVDGGKVTAVGAGQATIRCEAADGSGVYDECLVTVNPLPVSSIALQPTKLILHEEQTAKLRATVMPAAADNTQLQWTSSAEEVVTVEDGTVTAVGEGKATIRCAATDGSDAFAECEVTVTDLLPEQLYLAKGKTTTLQPADPSFASLTKTWISYAPKIATINKKGKLTALKPGKAQITLLFESYSESCEAIVYQFDSLRFPNGKAALKKTVKAGSGEIPYTITVKQKKPNATAEAIAADQKLTPTVKSSKPGVASATVSSISGDTFTLTVQPLKKGTTDITVKFAGKSARLTLTVKK